MRRAHDGTQGIATFSLRDEDGDIVEQTQMTFVLLKLTPEAVLLVLQQLLDRRDTWEADMRMKHEAPLGLAGES